MKGAGKSCKHERWNRWASYTSSQLQPSRAREEILLPRISAREATFLSLSLSLHGQDYLPTGLWTGNNYQSLENPSRKKELKTKKEKERKKRKTLLFHDCDYDSRLIRLVANRARRERERRKQSLPELWLSRRNRHSRARLGSTDCKYETPLFKY